MRVLVCGGRHYRDEAFVWNYLDEFGPPEISEVISGMARGVDMMAAKWARQAGLELHEFPADWGRYGKSGGPIRNRQMILEGKPDAVIAFLGGAGTANMVSQAERAGIPVHKVGW